LQKFLNIQFTTLLNLAYNSFQINQVAHFYKIPTNRGKFDVNKYFYKGELMWVDDIPDEEPSTAIP